MAKKPYDNGFIKISDLYLAYKKAKADAFYDNLHPNALAYTEFEKDLRGNIFSLHEILNRPGSDWRNNLDFIGEHLYMPKSIDQSGWVKNQDIHYLDVDPVEDWENQYELNRAKKLDVNYRLIISAKINYQILSSLWILKVGEKFEKKLVGKLSYGNRLRRQNTWSEFGTIKKYGELNHSCLGLFAPYFSAYQQWRNNGLKAMQKSVANGQKVTAITMDLAGFYHNVAPRFLLRPTFLAEIGVELTIDERKLTQNLLDSIDTWYNASPDKSLRPEGALPVGLSASKIISNVLLHQLDVEIRDHLKPIYYGRYVDDLFLVIPTPPGTKSGRDILKAMAEALPCLVVKYKKGEQPDLKLKLPYASDSNLFFTASKQKIFNLSSEHGLDLIDQISSQIRAQSSEYRLLPELPDTAADMAVGSLLASSNASLSADALRKADAVSIRRLGFSLLLKDIESYSKDLNRKAWQAKRLEFYKLISRHMYSPSNFFELFGYFPRIFKLVVANQDFDFARKFVVGVFSCIELIEKTTKDDGEIGAKRTLCRRYFAKLFLQGALQASTTKNFTEWNKLATLLRCLFKESDVNLQILSGVRLKKQSHDVLLSDWGSRSYKDYWYYEQSTDIRDSRIPRSKEVQDVIRWLKIQKFAKKANLSTPHWPALSFPTRPLTLQEIGLTCPAVFHDDELLRDSILALRGAKLSSLEKVGYVKSENDLYFYVPKMDSCTARVALTNYETTAEQWLAAAEGRSDRSVERYEKLVKLINNVLKEKKRPDYIVFPECSIPRRWAISIAWRLAREGISLISGLEYYPDGKNKSTKKLRNDSLVSLATRWAGYRSNIVYIQPKLQPSHGEKANLKKLGKSQYLPVGGIDRIPIYRHGNYVLGVVNCSDLTTPQNRVKYQGKVDGLYVLEWNPDVKTFGFLVEGAAHDVHTFVVQVNNRMYGDSRVRAPYRQDHARDIVQLKGGVSDYYVLGDMDFVSLRKYQKSNRMADKNSTFKPVPVGFKMSSMRKKIITAK